MDTTQNTLAFETEPNWDSLPELIPSTTVAAILKIDRKTLTKYVQTHKFAQPVERGASSAKYRKSDVIGGWRNRQVRIAQGYIKVDADPNSQWSKDAAQWEADNPGVDTGWNQGGQGVEEFALTLSDSSTPEVAPGPIPGGGAQTMPEPHIDGLAQLTRADFEALLTALVTQSQAPLVAQLVASEARIGEMVTAQERFMAQQTLLQQQQAAAWQMMMDEQRRLTGQVTQLTAALQARSDQEEAARLRAETEPASAWERFMRTLGISLTRR